MWFAPSLCGDFYVDAASQKDDELWWITWLTLNTPVVASHFSTAVYIFIGCIAHATSAFVDFLLWWKVSSKNAGFSMLNCPNKPHIIGIQWTFGNDTNHWSCQVINSRAERKNTSSFQPPILPPDDIHWGWATKYQWTPNATPLACYPKGWNFVSRFSLQEKKKIRGTLSKLVLLLCHAARVFWVALILTWTWIVYSSLYRMHALAGASFVRPTSVTQHGTHYFLPKYSEREYSWRHLPFYPPVSEKVGIHLPSKHVLGWEGNMV